MNNSLLFRSFLLFVLAISGVKTGAQNLVLNPSFENTSACPQGISQFNLALDWDDGNSGADSCTTSDLYAGCTPAFGGANSPNGLLGYQPSRTGNHHAGIILGSGFVGCIPLNDGYREYIQGRLSSPMIAGQRYVVSFFISLPEGVMWGSNSLGVYFTNSLYQRNACPNNQLISVIPQLTMCGPAVMDTINWVEIKWIYQAAGGEQFFTIGNFNNDGNTNRVVHNCSTFNPYIYYYIDDVSIRPYIVGSNECGISVQSDSTNATCGTSNGSARVLARSCSTPLSYLWSTGATGNVLQNVPSGNYIVTITDAANCPQTVSVTVNSTPLALNVSTTNPDCGSSNGSATVTATNGTGPFLYSWSNGGNTQTISNLNPGTYTVSVTGAPGCSATATAYLSGASSLIITPFVTNASCNSSNGSASVTVSGGVPPYSYLWSNGQTSSSITGLAAGSYSVTVQGDTAGSIFYSEDFSSGGTGWTLNTNGPGANGANANRWIVNNNSSCVCGTGNKLHITCDPALFFCLPTSGECTYFPGPNFSGDPTADKFVSSPDISTIGKTNITLKFNYVCEGEANVDYGLVRLSDNGGSTWVDLPTRYQGTSTCTQAVVSIPAAFENRANFKIAFRWINNANGDGDEPGFSVDDVELSFVPGNCPAVSNLTVGSSNGLSLTLNSVQSSCGLNNGSAAANITAGSGPYTYLWNTGATTQSITSLSPGVYSVTVTGAGGCSASASVSIALNSGLSAVATSTSATCGGSNGSVMVNVSGGGGSFTYLWSNGANTSSVVNLTPGIYTVTVTGADNCTATATATVSSSGDAVIFNLNSIDATCNNANGSLSVNITSGSSPFQYSWSNGGTTPVITSLSGGLYTVTVTGSGNCTASATGTVNSSSSIALSTTVINTTCGNNNGSATVTVTSGGSNYNYVWSNGATSSSISNLAAGTYTVTVDDGAGCSSTANAVVNPSGGNSAVITSDKVIMCSGDSAMICAPSGFAGYLWNTGQSGQCIFTKLAGNYYVTVTDAGNCTASSNRITINVYPLPPVSITVNGDTLTAYNAVTYQWYFNDAAIPGATSNVHIAQQTGNYTVAVTDTNGCRAVSTKISILTTGLSELFEAENVNVYPNPLEQGYWNLEVTKGLLGAVVEVFDNNARLVYRGSVLELKSEIDLDVASGIYMLRITSPKSSFTRKLIKL